MSLLYIFSDLLSDVKWFADDLSLHYRMQTQAKQSVQRCSKCVISMDSIVLLPDAAGRYSQHQQEYPQFSEQTGLRSLPVLSPNPYKANLHLSWSVQLGGHIGGNVLRMSYWAEKSINVWYQ